TVCDSDEVCRNGTCQMGITCPGDTTLCDRGCTDTSVDIRHCGGCGTMCARGEICDEGTCRAPGG
ncbi:MAG: EGF domain-containing protein, partial [Gammaproteobacteria bacterium]|nr:EGF domain-containing protein [Gammaproteobacteria bacterium]